VPWLVAADEALYGPDHFQMQQGNDDPAKDFLAYG
jgi:hypothetical protein